jgi:hypothetical protein
VWRFGGFGPGQIVNKGPDLLGVQGIAVARNTPSAKGIPSASQQDLDRIITAQPIYSIDLADI